jgi:hypothetical protein
MSNGVPWLRPPNFRPEGVQKTVDRYITAKTLTAAEYALLDQRVRTVLQKQGLDRVTLLEELQGFLRVYRDPVRGHDPA